MNLIKDILSDIEHREFPYPKGRWQYYQEWNNALFLHWVAPIEILRPLIPAELDIDTFEGNAYVSLVAFTMEKIRPRGLPSVSFISNFDEINVRTYIDNNNEKGVYFINIEAGKLLSSLLAKALSGLPYKKSSIRRNEQHYHAQQVKKNFRLDIHYRTRDEIRHKSKLDIWLTERYCLYSDEKDKRYQFHIHHKQWELNEIDLQKLELQYNIGNLKLNQSPTLAHYSKGVQVIAWGKQKLLTTK